MTEREIEFDIKIDRGPKIGVIKPPAIRFYEGKHLFKETDSSVEREEERIIEVYDNIARARESEVEMRRRYRNKFERFKQRIHCEGI